jgi:hypothetical protein
MGGYSRRQLITLLRYAPTITPSRRTQVFGQTFLVSSRSPSNEEAHEVPVASRNGKGGGRYIAQGGGENDNDPMEADFHSG